MRHTVYKIEDVAEQHRRKSHEAPILREAGHAESLGYERREDSKEKTVCH